MKTNKNLRTTKSEDVSIELLRRHPDSIPSKSTQMKKSLFPFFIHQICSQRFQIGKGVKAGRTGFLSHSCEGSLTSQFNSIKEIAGKIFKLLTISVTLGPWAKAPNVQPSTIPINATNFIIFNTETKNWTTRRRNEKWRGKSFTQSLVSVLNVAGIGKLSKIQFTTF